MCRRQLSIILIAVRCILSAGSGRQLSKLYAHEETVYVACICMVCVCVCQTTTHKTVNYSSKSLCTCFTGSRSASGVWWETFLMLCLGNCS